MHSSNQTDSDSDYVPESEEEESDDDNSTEMADDTDGETINSESELSDDEGSTDSDSLADFIVDDDDDDDTDDDDTPIIPFAKMGRGFRTLRHPCARLSRMLCALRGKAVDAAKDEVTDEADYEGTTTSDTRKRKRNPRIPHYTREENEYFYTKMSPEEQSAMQLMENSLNVTTMTEGGAIESLSKMPLRFRLLSSSADVITKRLLLTKLETLNNMNGNEGDYHKSSHWMQCAMRLPLGKYMKLPIDKDQGVPAIRGFLEETRTSLDNAVYGHRDSKEQILRILAKWISNPQSRGHCIGIQGAMGVGKSSLVKEGIAKALNLPFAYVALGGASDGAFLEGHSIAYEGSMHGKIAEVVMKAGCMNPVIFFDELDKVSETAKGEEVANILVHLTDPAQNEHFNDRFFTEIDLDLSKALMVFAYNDESKINPILLDRMTIIRANGYNNADKHAISKKHLIPNIMEQHGIPQDTLAFTDDILKTIVERVPEEKGVRNLRRGLESIISWYNMLQYLPDPEFEFNPDSNFEISEAFVRKYLKKQGGTSGMQEHVAQSMYM